MSQYSVRKSEITLGIWNCKVILENWLQVVEKLIKANQVWGGAPFRAQQQQADTVTPQEWRDNEKVVFLELVADTVQLVLEPWQGLSNGRFWKQGLSMGRRSLERGSATTEKLPEALKEWGEISRLPLPLICQTLSAWQEACSHRTWDCQSPSLSLPVAQNRAGNSDTWL